MEPIYIADVDNYGAKKWYILKDENKIPIPNTGTNDKTLYECYDDIKKLEKTISVSNFYCSRIGLDKERLIKYVIDIDGCDSSIDINEYIDDIIEYSKKIFSIRLEKEDFAFTKNDGYKHDNKNSFHIIIKSLIGVPADQHKFMTGLIKYNNKFKDIIDTSIYAEGKWLRLPNQRKGKSKGVFDPGVHRVIQGTLLDFIPEYYDKENTNTVSFEKKSYLNLIKKNTKIKKNRLTINDINSDNEIGFNKDQKLMIIPQLLEMLELEYSSDYNKWLKCMCIIKNELGDEGKNIARKFSEKSIKYDSEYFEKQWEKICYNGLLKLGSLIMYCYENPKNVPKLRDIKTNGINNIILSDNLFATELKTMISENFIAKKTISRNSETIKIYYFNSKTGWNPDTQSDSALSNYISHEFKDYIIKKYESNSSSWPKQYINIMKSLGSNQKKNQIIKEFKNLFIADSSNVEFDDDPYILKFNNGVMDLKTGKFREHKYTDYALLCTNIDWREPTKSELDTINSFFDSIFPETDMKNVLFKILASGLIGNLLEKFIIWYGVGGNGKGTINDFMCFLLGDYFGECPSPYLCAEREVGNDDILASFKGKRYLKSSEPSKSFNCAKIKSLTGEKYIKAIGKYETNNSSPMFKASYTLVCETNSRSIKMHGSDDDVTALKRRQISFPFIRKFTNDRFELEDNPNALKSNDLFKKQSFISQHIYAFGRTIIDHVDIYEKEGFDNLPAIVKELTNENLAQNSPFFEWWNNNYVKDISNDNIIGIRDLYHEFILSKNKTNVNSLKKQYTETNFKNFLNLIASDHIIVHKKVLSLIGHKKINSCSI